MHASIEQLLNLRDGDGENASPETCVIEQHVNECSLCRERLDELVAVREELNRLPVHSPQRDHWPEILEEAGYEKDTSGSRRFRWDALAGLAASLLLVTLIVVNQTDDTTETGLAADAIGDTPITAQDPSAADDAETDEQSTRKWTTEEIDALVARSQRLEQTLRAMPGRPSVKRASTSDTIMGLQQSIALVDYQINYGSGSLTSVQRQRLWRQRVDLMNSLVSVRYAEARPRRAASR